MEFRPCIDIHNGAVKQIVGSSLQDEGDKARENYVSAHDGAYYAAMFRDKGLKGGHVILLNPSGSEYYKDTCELALGALREYPGGLQIGGGIDPDNAGKFLDAGASHCIVTSYVFAGGQIRMDRLKRMAEAVGREHLVLDVSCRAVDSRYMVVTDRWQKITDTEVTPKLLGLLSEYCDEFLVHAVDVEGKNSGIEQRLAQMLGQWEGCPITYAGGVHSLEDVELLGRLGQGRLNVTVGSALDIYGGKLNMDSIIDAVRHFT